MSSKTIKQSAVDIKMLAYQNARDSVSGFSKGGRLLGLTRGQFSLIDLIVAVLDITGKADVISVTWSAGIKDAKQMKVLQNDDRIRKFTIITDHSYVSRQKQYAVTLEELFGADNIRTTEIHAKFTLIKNDDWNICIRTSMNLNANRTCENFEIDDDIEIFTFYKDFVDGVCREMPKGWVASSAIVNNALNTIFNDTKSEEPKKGSYVW